MASPAILGNVARFVLNSNNLSGDGNQVKLSFTQDTHDVSVFGDYWKEFLPGLSSATIDYTAFFDKATNTIDPTVSGLLPMGGIPSGTPSPAFEVDPNGNAAGVGIKYTGNAVVSKYDTDSKVNAPVAVTLSLKVTGAVTRAAY